MTKRISVSRVLKQRDKIFQLVYPFIGLNIVAGVLHDLVGDLYRGLPPTVSRDALFETCRVLAGGVLQKKQAAEFAWRMAGNMDLLICGKPVAPWTRQTADEWLPIQIIRVDPAVRRNKSGYVFQCCALAGSYCPGSFSQFMSRASCAAISRIVGFSKNKPYTNGLYFTNLRMWSFIEAARSAESLHFQQVDCSPSMRAHNAKIIGIRTRALPCPQRFDHPCERCVVGRNTCPAAIFAKQLVKKHCDNCATESYFDLDRTVEICFPCWQLRQLAQVAGH